jgi:hypothetical protein
VSQPAHSTSVPETGPELEALLGELQRIVDRRVGATLDWYRSRARVPRNAFRAAGTIVIIFSVSIPLLTMVSFTGRDVLLSAVAVSIAALTGLNSFFGWEQSWRSRRQTEFALEHLLALHEIRLIEIRREADPAAAAGAALEATRRLLEEAQVITGGETETFFRNIAWPQAEGG